MKRLLATTALIAFTTTPLLAQTTTEPAEPADTMEATAPASGGAYLATAEAGDIFANDLIGSPLYVTEADLGGMDMVTAEQQAEWESVGNISDIIVSQDDMIKAVLIDIGGFLGIGARTVAVDIAQLNFLREDTTTTDAAPVDGTAVTPGVATDPAAGAVDPAAGTTAEPAVVEEETYLVAMTGTREQLENAPEFERTAMAADSGAAMDAGAPVATTTDTDMAAETDADMAAGGASGALVAPSVEREGYMVADPEELTAENLTGSSVYGVEDEDIGNVSDLVLDADGAVTEAVIDVGGFLGLGAKNVAISFDEIQILRTEAGDEFRVYMDATQEQLEALPEYE